MPRSAAHTGRLTSALSRAVSGVQAGELILPVTFCARSATNLAARGDRNRAGRHQHEIGHPHAVRLRNRRRHFLFHSVKPVLRPPHRMPRFLISTIATSCSLLIVRDRDRRDAASGDLLDRRLDVVGIVVTPVHDQQILDAADDEQLAVGDDTQVAGAQPRSGRRARRRIDELPPKVCSDCCGFRQ